MNYIFATRALYNYIENGSNIIDMTYSAIYCKYYKIIYKLINSKPDVETAEMRIRRFLKVQKKLARLFPDILEYTSECKEHLICLYRGLIYLPNTSEQYCDLILAKQILGVMSNEFFADNIMEYMKVNFRGIYWGSEFIDELFLVPKFHNLKLLHKYLLLVIKIGNEECRFRINNYISCPPIGDRIIREILLFDDCFDQIGPNSYRLKSRTVFMSCLRSE